MSLLKYSWERFERRIEGLDVVERSGKILKVSGLIYESEGPQAAMGEMVKIEVPGNRQGLLAEVVGFRDQHLLLMPYGNGDAIKVGSKVVSCPQHSLVPVGDGLMGRVIDGFGRPLDKVGPLHVDYETNGHWSPLNPFDRLPIEEEFETGVKSIDLFTTMGKGQRMGIFAGSGVGKSSLMGMLARHCESEINVIALVGERGRELNEFIQDDLGPEGLKKSIIIVSTSDQPAPLRIRAAFLAKKIAEYFRDQGKNTLFLMDSITRLAMAQREIGLSIGEPPTTRGYTPSVFSMIPKLVERSGNSHLGSMTAFYTVLVEGDDMNEPIADTVRGLLDGHLVMRRSLATKNHYPAIDVLESVSRLTQRINSSERLEVIGQVRDLMGLYQQNEDLITVGAYQKGKHAKLDKAIVVNEKVMNFLRQKKPEKVGMEAAFSELKQIIT